MTLTERIAAAHAETPTCNASAEQPFTCHSLKCRTTALEMARPPAPRPSLSLVPFPEDERPDGWSPLVCAACDNCEREVCGCADAAHVNQVARASSTDPALCSDCDLCSYCGSSNLRGLQSAVVTRNTRYCSVACALDDEEVTAEIPVETMRQASEGRLR